ncbi:MAG: tetratricopeptide repeat protein, partial [Verrucomicrobiota bacterium]|nr:tetratricopeptide repeat protein [Verrucomicrobiota bacterium]
SAAPGEFSWKAEAQQRLAQLEHGGAPPAQNGAPSAGQPGVQQPAGDVIALIRTAETYEKEGQVRKAADALEQALKSNPKLVPPMLKLAELYAGPLKDKAKALDYAKRARELAPSDIHAARVLGRVAFQVGNWPWAAGLLQESARRLPDDAQVQYDYGWAAYSIGKVPEAQQAMQRVVELAPGTPEADDAGVFLSLTTSEANGPSSANDAAAVLTSKPDYVPALMFKARAAAATGDLKTAEEAYSLALQRFSEFAPAQRELADVYSADPKNASKAYDLAMKAKKTLPDDPDLSRLIGKISYQKKDYPQAIQVLQQSARKKPLDAEYLFYLGMAQMNGHQDVQGRQTLAQAFAAGLNGPRSDEAHAALEQEH